jgi:methionyl-tRNA formyltransferase
MTPWPGARSRFRGEPATFLATSAIPGRAEPGGVVAFERGAVAVGTGSGLLRIDRIQMAGKRDVSGEEFARGARPREGEEFLSPPGAGKLLERLDPEAGGTPPSSERP